MAFEQRAEALKRLQPHLIVDLHLYATADGGRKQAVPPGWGCLCFGDRQRTAGGWDGNPMLGDEWMYPGETRRVGYFFLSGEEAATALSQEPTFYIWENGIIGKAQIVASGRDRDVA
jgi:hypothetical protein